MREGEEVRGTRREGESRKRENDVELAYKAEPVRTCGAPGRLLLPPRHVVLLGPAVGGTSPLLSWPPVIRSTEAALGDPPSF